MKKYIILMLILTTIAVTTAQANNVEYTMELEILSIYIISDHDPFKDGDIYFNIKINSNKIYEYPEKGDKKVLGDGDTWQINKIFHFKFKSIDTIKMEVLDSDIGSDDSLGYIIIDHKNQTEITKLTSDPEHARITFTAEVNASAIESNKNGIIENPNPPNGYNLITFIIFLFFLFFFFEMILYIAFKRTIFLEKIIKKKNSR
jgi:hypothetical protein